MSVYAGDKAENIETAVQSIINQTLPAKEIIIVIDGPVPSDITEVLQNLQIHNEKIKLVASEKNIGLGNALKLGTSKISPDCDYIARMDSDDIACPERFMKQMKCFEADPELSVVGSLGQEFFNTPENLAGLKVVPEKHEDIVEFLKARCPFCHMTVIMTADILKKAGGYLDWYYAEDWYLWIRMYLAGAKFYNIQEPLVNVRINYDTFGRRGGIKYYKSIKGILKFLFKNKVIGFFSYTKQKIKRFVGHVCVPKKLKNKLYLKYLRSNGKK